MTSISALAVLPSPLFDATGLGKPGKPHLDLSILRASATLATDEPDESTEANVGVSVWQVGSQSREKGEGEGRAWA